MRGRFAAMSTSHLDPPFSLRRRTRIPVLLATAVGALGLATSIAVMWRSMRAVMDLGGTCASGGPYAVAAQCPNGAIELLSAAFPAVFVFGGLLAWGASEMCRRGAMVVVLAWPGLFLSLGWNFVEYGVNDRPVWGWLVCGLLFAVMGAAPLVAVPRLFRGMQEGRTALVALVAVAAAGGVIAGLELSALV
jgi:hypothetical protein